MNSINVNYIKPVCIMSLSIGYTSHNSIIFLKSLILTNFSGIVIIFAESEVEVKHNSNIVLYFIIINRSWPFITSKSHLYSKFKHCMLPNNIVRYKWAIYRYGLYYCFLKDYYSYFRSIFLLDLRDTVFQKNPEYITIGNYLYLCEDASYPYKIKNNYYDKKWIKPFFNNSNKIFERVPLNGGSIYGNSQQIKEFLYQLYFYLIEYYRITSDQGVINYIYYTHKLKNINIKINHNNNDSLYNMAVEIRDRNIFSHIPYVIEGSIVYRLDKSKPYIIHQYDRDKNLKEEIIKFYT